MIRYIIFLATFFLCNSVLEAQKYDYQWVGGYSDNQENGFGFNLIDFNNGVVEVSYLIGYEHYELGFDASFINDSSTGTLNLHSNGCHIKDTSWNNVSGDEYLQGMTFEVYCDIGYIPIEQGVLMLPDLLNSDKSFIITKDEEINQSSTDIYSKNLYYGIINKNSTVYEYEGLIKVNSDLLFIEDLTATPNASKDSWWVLQAKNQTNEIKKYLVGNDTMILDHTQSIGRPFRATEHGIGQNTFSPDGSIYAINSKLGSHLYDFDPEDGMLGNYRLIEYPDLDNNTQGLGFSPSGRFIYVTTAENVYQLDLLLEDEPYHVGYYRSFSDTGWPVGLGMIHPGPDCRLYVSPGSTTNWLHVILNPDEKGEACNFSERAIELPARLPHNLPNLPNYRYLTGCDSTIVFPFTTSTEDTYTDHIDFLIYPNPATHTINLPSSLRIEAYRVYNLQGQLVQNGNVTNQQVNVEDLNKGIHILEFINNNIVVNRQKMVITKR